MTNWEEMIARCEPIYATDEKTYLDAVKEAARAVPSFVGEPGIKVKSAETVLRRAVWLRNDYYRAHVVMHG